MNSLTYLMEICNSILSRSLKLVSKLGVHNVLIDQCNVILKERLKKLELFKDHKCRAFVLMVSDPEQRKRMLKKER